MKEFDQANFIRSQLYNENWEDLHENITKLLESD